MNANRKAQPAIQIESVNMPTGSKTVTTRAGNDALSEIPREHLIAMLKGAAWYSGGRECYGEHQGYSFDVQEETSLRDVIYRDEPLYKTPEEAIVAHWQRHHSPAM